MMQNSLSVSAMVFLFVEFWFEINDFIFFSQQFLVVNKELNRNGRIKSKNLITKLL